MMIINGSNYDDECTPRCVQQSGGSLLLANICVSGIGDIGECLRAPALLNTPMVSSPIFKNFDVQSIYELKCSLKYDIYIYLISYCTEGTLDHKFTVNFNQSRRIDAYGHIHKTTIIHFLCISGHQGQPLQTSKDFDACILIFVINMSAILILAS